MDRLAADSCIHVDADLNAQAEIFLTHPNRETAAAMLEAERIAKDPSAEGYTDIDKLFSDLKK